MATTGHCAYCFEVLAADLENRRPLSCRRVQDLWEQYQLLGKPEPDEEDEDPDLRDGKDLEEDSTDGLEEVDEDEEDEEEEDEEEQQQAGAQEQKSLPSTLQLPSISRLRAPTPGTPSSSSSTPSSLSTTSSQAALGTTSKSSSNSSFFSFSRSKQPSPAAPPKEESHPLFITWNAISRRGHKSLRGCIGTFDPQELSSGLKSYALTAAFDDTRFPPISPSELPSLTCSTTLLTHFTPALHPLDWTLGQHGIRIAFTHHGKRYGATYLPDVAVEQGWTKEETLSSLVRKAGAKVGSWRDVRGGVDVVRYEGRKATVGWEEWKGWRKWVDS